MNINLNRDNIELNMKDLQNQIDELKKRLEQLANKTPPVAEQVVVQQEVAGYSGPSMQELCEKFAMKAPPESTLTRIEDLERLTKELATQQQQDHASNVVRIEKLENSDHEKRITALEKGLKDLEASLAGVGQSDNSNVDTS
jgi:hypothetical protein